MRLRTATMLSALVCVDAPALSAPVPTAPVIAAPVLAATGPKTERPESGVVGAPLPGYWRYNTSFLFSDNTEMRCIGPADIDKVLRGPENRHYDCEYPVREVAGGKVRFEGACTNRKNGQKAAVSLAGTYDRTHFDFHGVVKADMGMLSLPLNASISARRLSPTCPDA